MEDSNKHCHFCGLAQNEVEVLIAGPNVFICNNCVEMCREMVENHRQKRLSSLEEDEKPEPIL